MNEKTNCSFELGPPGSLWTFKPKFCSHQRSKKTELIIFKFINGDADHIDVVGERKNTIMKLGIHDYPELDAMHHRYEKVLYWIESEQSKIGWIHVTSLKDLAPVENNNE